MDKYFDSLNDLSNPQKERKMTCCNNVENMMVCEEISVCRICKEKIKCVASLPEKCYEGGKNTSRTGMPTSELLPDSGVGSVISNSYGGNTNMRLISRLNTYTGIPYKTRSILNVFQLIYDNCVRHNVSKKIINEAQGIYSIVSQYKITRGKNRIGLIASCVFISCKNCASPRSSHEIAIIMNADKKTVTKGLKEFNDIIRINRIPLDRICMTRVQSTDLIDRYCNHLPLNELNIMEIKDLCSYFTETFYHDISASTPPSISASIINVYCIHNNLPISKKDISDNSGISVVTITKITSQLLKLLNQQDLI